MKETGCAGNQRNPGVMLLRREAGQAASEMRVMQTKLWEAQATVESKHRYAPMP